jgi:hypothetical protein
MFIRLLCIHSQTFIRTSGNRLYTECVACGHESAGIETGTFQYHPDVYSRLQHTERFGKACVDKRRPFCSTPVCGVPFQVEANRGATDTHFESGRPMLRETVKNAVKEWKFSNEAADHRIKATIHFKTNCPSKPG